ncbi:MAG: arginine deiminase family protein, partial [Draconibacterium sp.]|nr:arginine deiminase family protein [Draconibacterium sp.]
MFKNSIVKIPGKSMVDGITTAGLGKPDYQKALVQHANYINVLKSCGVNVEVIEANESFPDSTFVEDVALLTPHCAIITNPGAPSRKEEIYDIRDTLKKYFKNIEEIIEPGTVEAGDIMMVGSHFYIGLSERTNEIGAAQIINILEKYNMTGSIVKLEHVLHLKTGVAYLENNNLLACGEFLSKPEFQKFNLIEVEEDESYAANCIWVNGVILVPTGFPKTKTKIENTGYKTIEVDVSEFQKLDGGLSCLSLRF